MVNYLERGFNSGYVVYKIYNVCSGESALSHIMNEGGDTDQDVPSLCLCCMKHSGSSISRRSPFSTIRRATALLIVGSWSKTSLLSVLISFMPSLLFLKEGVGGRPRSFCSRHTGRILCQIQGSILWMMSCLLYESSRESRREQDINTSL